MLFLTGKLLAIIFQVQHQFKIVFACHFQQYFMLEKVKIKVGSVKFVYNFLA
jgi:hypothetical protein